MISFSYSYVCVLYAWKWLSGGNYRAFDSEFLLSIQQSETVTHRGDVGRWTRKVFGDGSGATAGELRPTGELTPVTGEPSRGGAVLQRLTATAVRARHSRTVEHWTNRHKLFNITRPQFNSPITPTGMLINDLICYAMLWSLSNDAYINDLGWSWRSLELIETFSDSLSRTIWHMIITGPPNEWSSIVLHADFCRLSSSSVTLLACGPAGRPPARGNAAWERCRRSGRPEAGRVGGRAVDTVRWASTVTSR